MIHFFIKTLFYTAGVVGFLLIAFVIAKNSMNGTMSFKKKNSNLEIEESLSISPRKTLHIIKAFDEKFLIASDATSTTLLAKLNSDGEIEEQVAQEDFSTLIEEKMTQDKAEIKTGSVIHSMLNKLK